MAQCRAAPCCYTPYWQYSEACSDPRWVLKPGAWSFTPPPPAPAGLLEFFMLDSSPYIDETMANPKYLRDVPHGLSSQRPLIAGWTSQLLKSIDASTATWKVFVSHHTLQSYGTHCAFSEDANVGRNARDLVVNVAGDQCGCAPWQSLKAELLKRKVRRRRRSRRSFFVVFVVQNNISVSLTFLNPKNTPKQTQIPAAFNGHDHSVQGEDREHGVCACVSIRSTQLS